MKTMKRRWMTKKLSTNKVTSEFSEFVFIFTFVAPFIAVFGSVLRLRFVSDPYFAHPSAPISNDLVTSVGWLLLPLALHFIVPPLLIASVKTFLMALVKTIRRFLEIFPACLFGDILARKRLSEAYILPTPTTTLLSIMNDLIFLFVPTEDSNSVFSSNS